MTNKKYDVTKEDMGILLEIKRIVEEQVEEACSKDILTIDNKPKSSRIFKTRISMPRTDSLEDRHIHTKSILKFADKAMSELLESNKESATVSDGIVTVTMSRDQSNLKNNVIEN